MSDEDTQWPALSDVNAAREIVRLGEIKMEDLLSMALAADTRANTLAYTFATVSAALLVTALGLGNVATPSHPAVWAAGAAAATFLASAGMAMWASRPTLFYTRGFNPRDLGPRAPTEIELLRWAAEDLADRIDVNIAAQTLTTSRTTKAHWFGVVATASGPAAALIAWCCG
ncbi:hypothetical protein E5673_08940 [Sphingomonas sp. PAMC26645]|uniref:hypothetical protein n=1 Tax=Sphingomonas sp. PAMC26645 TaxID=2565555 RepID=UPI00109E2DE8|nr:hypothetical protein [Sphingomonas sp. PAMC26645]QCB42340.1 hypothetical protein E5673_08940 [Sphingomonas sp. PAMC26645]